MLEDYFVKPTTCDRIRANWLGVQVEKHVTWLRAEGYNARSVLRRVPIIIAFSDFAKSRGVHDCLELPAHISDFVTLRVQARCHGRSASRQREIRKEVRSPVEQFLRQALPGYEGSHSRRLSLPFGGRVAVFFEYLRDERGLREATIRQYEFRLRQFESYLGRIGCPDLSALSPPVVGGFLVEKGARLAKSGIRDACGCLRVFLRFLHREGLTPTDLSSSVESPRVYRFSSVPRSVTWDEVRKILATVDLRTPLGLRDYAILLLLVTYGLRAHEVASLTLEDVDWETERLYVPGRKAGHSTAFPLSAVVGKAILDYLKGGRPPTDARQIFLRALAPYRPIRHNAVSCRVTRYIRLAGISVPRPGSHTLRHTCVQRLVDAELSLKEIGDYVGHRSPDSTKIYTKIAIDALRQVALGAGEEVL